MATEEKIEKCMQHTMISALLPSLKWLGHVLRTEDTRIVKKLLKGSLLMECDLEDGHQESVRRQCPELYQAAEDKRHPCSGPICMGNTG